MSGFILSHELSWDQKRGIEPRFCTTELIWEGIPPAVSSNTICSVSTSLATLPFSLTPRFKYLIKENDEKQFYVRGCRQMTNLTSHCQYCQSPQS